MLLDQWDIDERELARQMACPCGDVGRCLAQEMQRSNREVLEFCLSKFPESPKKALELGHGNGAHIETVFEKKPDLLYFGLEVSETMFQEAIQHNQSRIQKNKVAFAVYDGQHIPFYDNTFDVAFSLNTIYFWKNPVRLLKEMYRVMEVGGVFIIAFCTTECMKKMPYVCYGFKLYEIEEWRVFFENEGFYIEDESYYMEAFELGDQPHIGREFVRLCLRKI
ncbi:Methyltransferase domain-containing protein [Cruoricaptor ignavus]|uniref:Methyltransferase domain-containing protein n=1 Tax=Cruoricaptor ignavus TaxID=1118202 RepID=A0A1M6HKC2_9FLAO|nr:class I SAM-dependent methyltransferase [Cruoricaptor ignavus]SHJ22631.1 Methyltransferase domain-containing protein [Cruoricaptor ignavus]